MSFKDAQNRDPDLKSAEDVQILLQNANVLASEHAFLPLFTMGEIVKILDRHDPGIITVNAVISALQSHEVIKILHWFAGNSNLGDPIRTYVVFNAMTMKFFHIEKKRNPHCRQCGDTVRRVELQLPRNVPCQTIINFLKAQGYELDPEMVPLLTIMDFNMVREIDLDQTANRKQLARP